MTNKFSRLQDKQSWERLIAESREHPVLLFKHSNSCAISSRAYREMEQLDRVNLLDNPIMIGLPYGCDVGCPLKGGSLGSYHGKVKRF
jgi:hypothetical protein